MRRGILGNNSLRRLRLQTDPKQSASSTSSKEPPGRGLSGLQPNLRGIPTIWYRIATVGLFSAGSFLLWKGLEERKDFYESQAIVVGLRREVETLVREDGLDTTLLSVEKHEDSRAAMARRFNYRRTDGLSDEALTDAARIARRIPDSKYAPRSHYMVGLDSVLRRESAVWRRCAAGCSDSEIGKLLRERDDRRLAYHQILSADSAAAISRLDQANSRFQVVRWIFKGSIMASVALLGLAALCGTLWFVSYRYKWDQTPPQTLAWALRGMVVESTGFAVLSVAFVVGFSISLFVLGWTPHLNSARSAALALYAFVAFARGGRNRRGLDKQIGRILGWTGGTIHSIARTIQESPRRRIDERQAFNISRELLARVNDLAKLLFIPPGDNPLRVTLAVPISADSRFVRDGSATSLRVWAYDENYPDRHWTSFPIDKAGSPRAYRDKEALVIPDLHELDENERYGSPSCRSVVCFPVLLRLSTTVECMGVLCIDSPHAHFFGDGTVEQTRPMISPVLNLLALLLNSVEPGATYVFHD